MTQHQTTKHQQPGTMQRSQPGTQYLLLLLGAAGCVSPKAGEERRVTVQGTFVSGAGAATSQDGTIKLQGQLSFAPRAPQAK